MAGGLGPAYGATDVWNDPAWLRATAASHVPQARQAAERLQELQQEAGRRQQADIHRENIAARMQNQQNVERARRDTLREQSRTHRDAAAQRALEGQRLEAYRQAGLQERGETAQSRKDLTLLNIAQSPELMSSFGKQAPAIQRQLLEQAYARASAGGLAGGGPVAGPMTLAALAGGATQDPGTAAVRGLYAAKGDPRATAPSPTSVAPSAAAAKAQTQAQAQPQNVNFAPADLAGGEEAPPPRQMTGYHWTAGTGGVSGGNNATMTKYYDDGTSEVVPASSTPGVETPSAGPTMADLFAQGKAQALEAGTPYVEGGRVVGGPAGQDYNVSTGEWMPSSTVGTINGRPAPQVVAEGAMKRGVSPEDTRSRGVYEQMQKAGNLARGQATTPPMDIPLGAGGPAPLPGIPEEAQGAAAGQPGAGGESQRGAVSKFLAPPGSGAAALFGLDKGVSPIVQPPAAAPAVAGPAPSTNRPFFGSPELANQTGGGPAAPPTTPSGRGEFRAEYGQQANVPGRPLDFPSTPPSYVNPKALPGVQGPQTAGTPPTGPEKGGVGPQAAAPQMNFSDVVEQVPPPNPESVPAGLTRPRSPNEVVVQGQMPMMPQEMPPQAQPKVATANQAALEEQRRRKLY